MRRTIQTYGPGTISMLGGDDHYDGWADEFDGEDGYDVCYAAPDSVFTSCETLSTTLLLPRPDRAT
jgi:hypothetical protein